MKEKKYLDDFSTKPIEYFHQQRKEMLGFIPEDARTILDVGCGAGVFAQQLKTNKKEIWGIELDKDVAKEAKKVLDTVLVGDIMEQIDALPKNYFDCVVFNDVLSKLVDPYMVLREMKKKLTSDGVIVCSIPNVRYLLHFYEFVVKKQWHYEESGILDKTHVRFFTEKSIQGMCSSLGFEMIDMKGINGINSYKFTLLNIASLGYLSDTKYMQFACVVRPR